MAIHRHPLLLLTSLLALLLLLLTLLSTTPSLPSSLSSHHHHPLHSHLNLVFSQATNHLALSSSYSSYSLRLKLDSLRQLTTFQSLSSSLLSLSRNLSDPNTDESSLRSLEKEAKDLIKLTRQLVADSKDSFDTQFKIQKLRDTIFAVQEQLQRSKKLGTLASSIAAHSTPKSLHCLAMRLLEYRISHPRVRNSFTPTPRHNCFVILSNNVIAVSVVVNSAIKNARKPSNYVFYVVTDSMYLAAMEVWFELRTPAGGARVVVKSVGEFGKFLNSSYSPVVGRNELSMLEHLRFYLPEMFPNLRRIVLLEDDVVVQRDLSGLWEMDLDGKVNGAVEMCFGGFRRYSRYLNFSNPVVEERFSPRACAWAYGVNVFDLDAWRRERSTDRFHEFMNLNVDGTLWKPGSILPAGLATFYTTTKPIEKTWHVMGLGYNPSISSDEIRRAAVIHFNGNMKPWLDVALNQYKQLWTKYIDTEMEFLQLCNFGV